MPAYPLRQVTYDFYVVGGGKIAAALFEPPPGETLDGITAPYLTTHNRTGRLDADGDVDEIDSSFLARPDADCGRLASWTWDGKRFRLFSDDAMEQCRGVSPEDWLILYRAAKGEEHRGR